MSDDNQVHLLDSNIIVYAYDISEPKKQARARMLLEHAFAGARVFAVALQNLNEFFVTSTAKVERPISIEEARLAIRDITLYRKFRILTPTVHTVLKAISISKKGIRYWDAFLAATMLENGITHIYTENTKDFQKVDGIVAINPFV